MGQLDSACIAPTTASYVRHVYCRPESILGRALAAQVAFEKAAHFGGNQEITFQVQGVETSSGAFKRPGQLIKLRVN
jgi:hypothetical protein